MVWHVHGILRTGSSCESQLQAAARSICTHSPTFFAAPMSGLSARWLHACCYSLRLFPCQCVHRSMWAQLGISAFFGRRPSMGWYWVRCDCGSETATGCLLPVAAAVATLPVVIASLSACAWCWLGCSVPLAQNKGAACLHSTRTLVFVSLIRSK